LEPLLGSIDCNQAWRNSKLPNWVIVGGESGPNARACNLRWIRSIIEQCRAVGVACFVKQLGANPQRPEPYQGMPEYPYSTGKGGDPNEWPEDLRVRQFPQVEWRRCSWAERDV